MPGPLSPLAALPDPTDLPALRAALAAEDPQRRLVPLDLHRIALGPEVVGTVADAVTEQRVERAGQVDRARPIVLLVDATPIGRAGADLKALVEDQLVARFGTERPVRRVVLRGQHPTLHVDDDTLDSATAAVTGAAAVVAVGGGTISDIAKVAAARAAGSAPGTSGAVAGEGGIPLVVVQTAASVDGYTDNVSVVLRDGVKRTIPSRWPDVVVADVTTISAAPERLNSAGYGEGLSTFTAPADWYLASRCGLDSSFHPAARDLLAASSRGIEEWSPGLARHELGSVERLTRMLLVRGMVTGVAGTTACLSGVEHLVSHMLDMYHGAHDRPIGLHGAQVGVASVLAAAAWEHLFARFDPAAVDQDALFGDPEAHRPRVLAAFAELDPTGRLGASVGATTRPSCAGGTTAGRPWPPCSPTGTPTGPRWTSCWSTRGRWAPACAPRGPPPPSPSSTRRSTTSLRGGRSRTAT